MRVRKNRFSSTNKYETIYLQNGGLFNFIENLTVFEDQLNRFLVPPFLKGFQSCINHTYTTLQTDVSFAFYFREGETAFFQKLQNTITVNYF